MFVGVFWWRGRKSLKNNLVWMKKCLFKIFLQVKFVSLHSLKEILSHLEWNIFYYVCSLILLRHFLMANYSSNFKYILPWILLNAVIVEDILWARHDKWEDLQRGKWRVMIVTVLIIWRRKKIGSEHHHLPSYLCNTKWNKEWLMRRIFTNEKKL